MAERDQIEQLNLHVDSLLSGSSTRAAGEQTPIGDMLRIAGDLRTLPDPDFRMRLKQQIAEAAHTLEDKEKIRMTATTPRIRPGFRTVTPYVHVQGAGRFIQFLKDAFGAEERTRVNMPNDTIMHAEVTIGDSVLELADSEPTPTGLHLYVPDADDVYHRALAAGGTSLHPLTNQPYGDREGSVRDPFGNNWYIATHQGGSYTPEGLHSLTPYLHPRGTAQLIDFMKRAFGAEELMSHASPDGTIVHAKIRVGDSVIEMGEAHAQWQPMAPALHLYVDDADAMYARALQEGATSLYLPNNAPYGDRASGVTDPLGNRWYIHTYLG